MMGGGNGTRCGGELDLRLEWVSISDNKCRIALADLHGKVSTTVVLCIQGDADDLVQDIYDLEMGEK